jgi:hypothetical protein
MREGWLTAVHDPRHAVYGVLWDVALSDVAALDRYEGMAEGLYVKVAQSVIASGGVRRALIYFGANAGPGLARPEYIANVLAAARSWHLPAQAIEALERIERASPANRRNSTPPSARGK